MHTAMSLTYTNRRLDLVQPVTSDPAADSLTDHQQTGLSQTAWNRAVLCRDVKETTKKFTQVWVDGQQSEFHQKLMNTERSHGTKGLLKLTNSVEQSPS
jgi:hypothetical protein